MLAHRLLSPLLSALSVVTPQSTSTGAMPVNVGSRSEQATDSCELPVWPESRGKLEVGGMAVEVARGQTVSFPGHPLLNTIELIQIPEIDMPAIMGLTVKEMYS